MDIILNVFNAKQIGYYNNEPVYWITKKSLKEIWQFYKNRECQ